MKIQRLFDIPYHNSEKGVLEKAFNTKYNTEWHTLSNIDFITEFESVARGLLNLGIQAGDKIALISHNNRTEWHILDYAIQIVGAISVPIYPTITIEDYNYIFNHAEIKLCFVSNESLYQKVSGIAHKIASLQEIYTFDVVSGAKSWQYVKILGANYEYKELLDQRKKAINYEDLVTIIYTSGTTGIPKGVMLSHKNILSNIFSLLDLMPIQAERVLSFLPICHIFERTATYIYQFQRYEIYFAETMEKIGENAKEIKPHLMIVVPRLLEKIYDKIILKARELSGIKRILFFWALRLGTRYEMFHKQNLIYRIQLKIARKFIFSKWQEALGGELKLLISGSAKLDERLIRIFNAADMPVVEGYGLTETAPVIAGAKLEEGRYETGTCGTVIDGVIVKIATDGEILVKGANVMMGYYKDPEQTTESFTADGYFKTGDIGNLIAGKYLKITDRKKEIFKTSGGKYIAPQLIESKLKTSLFIEQAMVVGAGEKMPCAFLQPDFEFLKTWIKEKKLNINILHNKNLVKNKEVIMRIKQAVEEINDQLAQWEKIKLFSLVPDIWSVDNDLITPTMKLKRKNIMNYYIKEYNKMYEKNN